MSYMRAPPCVSCASSTSKSVPLYKARCHASAKSSTARRRTHPTTPRRGMSRLLRCPALKPKMSDGSLREGATIDAFSPTYQPITCSRVTVPSLLDRHVGCVHHPSQTPLSILCFMPLDGMTDIVCQIRRLRPSATSTVDPHHHSNRAKSPTTTVTAVPYIESARTPAWRDTGPATTPAQQIHWPELAVRLSAHWALPIRHPQRIYFRPWHPSTSKRP